MWYSGRGSWVGLTHWMSREAVWCAPSLSASSRRVQVVDGCPLRPRRPGCLFRHGADMVCRGVCDVVGYALLGAGLDKQRGQQPTGRERDHANGERIATDLFARNAHSLGGGGHGLGRGSGTMAPSRQRSTGRSYRSCPGRRRLQPRRPRRVRFVAHPVGMAVASPGVVLGDGPMGAYGPRPGPRLGPVTSRLGGESHDRCPSHFPRRAPPHGAGP